MNHKGLRKSIPRQDGDTMYKLQVPKTTAKDPQPQILPIEKWIGVNQFVTPSAIEDNEFVDAQNMQLTDNGLPDKRNGFEKVIQNSFGTGKINGFYVFNGKLIIAHGNNIYIENL